MLHKRRNGTIVERVQNGGENRAQQNAEGDAKETAEKKRKDDADRNAASEQTKPMRLSKSVRMMPTGGAGAHGILIMWT